MTMSALRGKRGSSARFSMGFLAAKVENELVKSICANLILIAAGDYHNENNFIDPPLRRYLLDTRRREN